VPSFAAHELQQRFHRQTSRYSHVPLNSLNVTRDFYNIETERARARAKEREGLLLYPE